MQINQFRRGEGERGRERGEHSEHCVVLGQISAGQLSPILATELIIQYYKIIIHSYSYSYYSTLTRPSLLAAWLQTKPGVVCHRIERAPYVTSHSKPNTPLPASELVDPLPKYLSNIKTFYKISSNF